MTKVWEQRWHPLSAEWVIVAAHRQDRPWLGETLGAAGKPLPAHDAECTFCPGNTRISGARNPDYRGVYVFDNDRPCAGPDAPRDLAPAPGIYQNRPADGLARVVCFTPRHDLTLAELDVAGVDAVLQCWQAQYRELGSRPGVQHVLIFENKGEVVGVSNPHPHGQIYATNFVFKTIENEVAAARAHFAVRQRPLWEEIVATELDDGRRVLGSNDHAAAFVPYFARYAYETFVGPRRAVPSISDLGADERQALAEMLHQTLVRFDNLWRAPFPYVLALHNAPTDGGDHRAFGFHFEFHPPLRKPGLLKYLAGPEIGGGSFLADTAPEDKAAELRRQPLRHYKAGGPA
jgi:UDPglucose--hexose-1-phosphate uridylyltransferase